MSSFGELNTGFIELVLEAHELYGVLGSSSNILVCLKVRRARSASLTGEAFSHLHRYERNLVGQRYQTGRCGLDRRVLINGRPSPTITSRANCPARTGT